MNTLKQEKENFENISGKFEEFALFCKNSLKSFYKISLSFKYLILLISEIHCT